MAVINLDYLKTFFQTYDKPTEEEFADLIDTLSTTIRIVTYNIAGSNSVWADVNATTQIIYDQKTLLVIYHAGVTYIFDGVLGTYGVGGISTNQSNYVKLVESQFTTDQVNAILNLIAVDVDVETNLDVDIFEAGVETVANYLASITYGDATINSIKLNGTPYSVNPGGYSTVPNSSKIYYTKIYNLVIDYTLNGTVKQYNDTLTATSYIPQFYGLSPTTDYDGAPTISIPISKYVGDGNSLSIDNVYNNMYIWFILSDTNSYVYDQNSNRFRQGSWGDDTFIIKKDGKIQLENGDLADVTFYRSKTPIDSNGIQFKCETK